MASGKNLNSLFYKIAFGILLPSVVITVLITTLLYENTVKLTKEKYNGFLQEVNRSYTHFIETKLENVASKAKMSAMYIEKYLIVQDNPDKYLEVTKDICRSDDFIYGSAVAFVPDESNRLGFYYSYMQNDEVQQFSFNEIGDSGYFDYPNMKLEWWNVPSSSLHSGWTRPYFDKEAGKSSMLTYFHPFYKNGEFKGIVTVDISLDMLKNELKKKEDSFKYQLPSQLILVSSDSTILYTDKYFDLGFNVFSKVNLFDELDEHANEEIIAKAMSGTYGFKEFETVNNRKKILAFYTPIHNAQWYAIALMTQDQITKDVISQMIKLFLAIFAIFVLILVLIVFISKRIVSPIRKLSSMSLKIAQGDYNQSIDLQSKDEIGTLANNFNKMAHDLQKRENDLMQANEELRVLDVAKTKFLLLISHEIRTLLNGIIGLTSIIKEGNTDEENGEYIGLLEESINRLNEFSKRALDIVQLQTRGTTAEKKPIQLQPLVERITDIKLDATLSKDLSFKIEIAPELTHFGLEEHFIDIVSELIDNSIKHSPEEGIIHIGALSKNNHLHFSVTNHGEPIPAEFKQEILKPFGLVERHIDKNIGLGLHYVKSYVEILKGDLTIHSNDSETTFELIFND